MGQPWTETVTLGRTAELVRDGKPSGLTVHDDGTVSVVGTMLRRLGDHGDRAMLLDAGPLRVVVLRDREIGRAYEATGRLWEDRHGTYLSDEEGEEACLNGPGVVEKVWLIPDVVGTADGAQYQRLGPGPGVEVQQTTRDGVDGHTIRLQVRM